MSDMAETSRSVIVRLDVLRRFGDRKVQAVDLVDQVVLPVVDRVPLDVVSVAFAVQALRFLFRFDKIFFQTLALRDALLAGGFERFEIEFQFFEQVLVRFQIRVRAVEFCELRTRHREQEFLVLLAVF